MSRKTHYSQLSLTTKKGVPLRELTEAEVQRQCVELLRKSGYLVVRLNSLSTKQQGRFLRSYYVFGSETPSSGMPDLLAFKADRCLLLEVKRRIGKASEVQDAFHQLAAQYGVTVAVVRSIDDVLQLIRPP